MHSARSISASLAACAMTAGLVTTGPVQAVPLEKATETFSFSETFNNFCETRGLRVRVAGEGTVSYRLDSRGADGSVFYAEHFEGDFRLTNVRTGAYVTSHESSMYKDLSITDNGDGTITVVFFGTGNAVVYDSSGTAIGRNPGQTRWKVVIDLNGTPDDFSDDKVISEEVILGSTGRTDDFCAVVVPALT